MRGDLGKKSSRMLINIFPGWILESDMNKGTIADCLWPYPFF